MRVLSRFGSYLIALILLCGPALGQNSYSYFSAGTGSSSSTLLQGTAVKYHQITWGSSGTVSTCAVKVEQSADNSIWSDLIAAQTCTSSGSSLIVQATVNYIRITFSVAVTGGGTVSAVYTGWNTAPSTNGFVFNGVLASIPATCTVGNLAFITNATAGQNIYMCTATNTWTQVTGGGGGITNSAGNNVITKSNGTNLVASSVSDDGTTVSTAEAASVLSLTTAGTTAGVVALTQGSSNSGIAPCTTANTRCRQAAAAVTSFTQTEAGAAPVNNNSAELFSNASPSVGVWAKMPQTTITSGSAYTNASTTFSSVVGGSGQTLAFSVEANTKYVLQCKLLWQGSAATSGIKVQITGPASPTAVQYSLEGGTGVAAVSEGGATAFSTSLSVGTAITATTNFPADVAMGLVNGANAGTVTLQAASQGAGTLTIQPGSWCQLQ